MIQFEKKFILINYILYIKPVSLCISFPKTPTTSARSIVHNYSTVQLINLILIKVANRMQNYNSNIELKGSEIQRNSYTCGFRTAMLDKTFNEKLEGIY